jgi:hypothetical protein
VLPRRKNEEKVAVSSLRSRKKLTVGLVGLFVLAGAGAAFAYWTATGTGTGTATTGESVAFAVTTQPPVGVLAPGNAGQTVTYTVDNPGSSAQRLTNVTVTIAGPNGAPWQPAGNCRAADYTATMTSKPPVGDIAAGGSSTPGTVTVTLANTGANQDDCQGQSVPLYLVAS